MSIEVSKKTELGITHKVVFDVPSQCTIQCKTSSGVSPAAIVMSGSKYRPGFFYHDVESGSYGPFDTWQEACQCHPNTDEEFKGWIVIVPTVKVEV